MTATARRLLEWLPALIFVVLALCLFPSVGTDDAYITYWPAHTLSTTGDIVNYNGARVEQSSSMLHVVLLALLARITGASLPALGAVLGLVCGAMTVVITQRLAALVHRRLALLAGVVTALSKPLLYWSVCGLETTLAAVVGASLLACTTRYIGGDDAPGVRRGAHVIVALIVAFLLVRPEAIAVIVSTLIGVGFLFFARTYVADESDRGRRRMVTPTTLLLLMSVSVFAAIVGFRLAYFGGVVPQPVVAKVGTLAVERGVAYFHLNALTKSGTALWVLASAGVVLIGFRTVAARSMVPAATLVGVYAATQSAFVLMAGGDWMPNGRFLVPMLPMVVISALFFVHEIRPKLLVPVGVFLVACQVWPLVNIVRYGSPPPIWTLLRSDRQQYAGFSWLEHANFSRHYDMPAIIALREVVSQVSDGKPNPVSIMTGQMGMVPYHLGLTDFGRVRMIDRFGLTTRDFVTCPVSAALPRDALGLRVDYGFFLKHRTELREECGLGDPDVIFDLTTTLRRLGADANDPLDAHGYAVMYRELGRFIAVRKDLAGLVRVSGASVATD